MIKDEIQENNQLKKIEKINNNKKYRLNWIGSINGKVLIHFFLLIFYICKKSNCP